MPYRPPTLVNPYDNGDDDPSSQIVSFPASVQRKLDEARSLLRQDRPTEAASSLHQAGLELARTAPEVFALMVGAQMGLGRSLVFEQSEMDTRTVQTDRFAFGIRYGRDVKTTTAGKTQRRSITLG